MTITQTVDIPASRQVLLDLPSDLPVGRAKIDFTVTPESSPQDKDIKPLASLLGIHKGLDTMDAYFARKRAEKALEDAQFERNLKKAP